MIASWISLLNNFYLKTANYNYEALKQFYNKFSDFKGRPTIISGESYAGVYLPMLANLIINGQKNFQINFKVKGEYLIF